MKRGITDSEVERHIFAILQRRQKAFLKAMAAGFAASAFFVTLSIYHRWPGAMALLPWGLIGPFAVSVITARCPRCAKLIHRNPLAAFRPLQRCSRCGFRG
jgi:hypothetical protein